jgi:hypothetical protein
VAAALRVPPQSQGTDRQFRHAIRWSTHGYTRKYVLCSFSYLNDLGIHLFQMQIHCYKHWHSVDITLCTVKVKVRVKFTLDQATKAQRGSRGIALLSL